MACYASACGGQIHSSSAGICAPLEQGGGKLGLGHPRQPCTLSWNQLITGEEGTLPNTWMIG